jgi:hypothetical protein
MTSRSRGAMRPRFAFISRPLEGVGNAGCLLHPQPRVHFVLVERTFAVRSNISRQRAVDRSQVPKNPPCDPIARKTLPRPPHPVPYVRDDRDTPLCGVGRLQLIEMFLPGTEAKSFLKWDSTTAQIIGPSRSNKLHGPSASGSIHPAVASSRPICAGRSGACHRARIRATRWLRRENHEATIGPSSLETHRLCDAPRWGLAARGAEFGLDRVN